MAEEMSGWVNDRVYGCVGGVSGQLGGGCVINWVGRWVNVWVGG